jgi:hypothetical protein
MVFRVVYDNRWKNGRLFPTVFRRRIREPGDLYLFGPMPPRPITSARVDAVDTTPSAKEHAMKAPLPARDEKGRLILSASQAKYQLVPKIVLDVKGGIRINVRGHTIAIYGAAKPGKQKIYYTVARPSSAKRAYSSDWAEVVKTTLREIHRIENGAPNNYVELFDQGALRYQELIRSVENCHDYRSALVCLHALGNVIGKNLPPVLVELMQTVALVTDQKNKLPILVKRGIEFDTFATQRDYMPPDEFFPYFATFFPARDALVDNEVLKEQFLDDWADRASNTIEQYCLKITEFNADLGETNAFFVTPKHIEDHIKKRTYNEVEGEGVIINTTVHDQIGSILHTYFGWLKKNNHYPKALPNPAKVKKEGTGSRDPSPEDAIWAKDIQRWMDEIQWEDFAYFIFSVKLGIRSDTIPRLTWADVKWDLGYVDITNLKSKCGSSRPKLTPEILEMLKPFRGCKGTIVVHTQTQSRILRRAIALKIFSKANNQARKTAISNCYEEGKKLYGDKDAPAVMDEMFGNSADTRNTWYKIPRSPEEAQKFRECKRILPEIFISKFEARRYLGAQYAAFVRTEMALRRKKKRFKNNTAHHKIEKIAETVWNLALKEFRGCPSLPTNVKIRGLGPDEQLAPLWSGRTTRPKRFNPLLPPNIINKLNEVIPEDPTAEIDGQPSLWSVLPTV